jgi:hypothetical protein
MKKFTSLLLLFLFQLGSAQTPIQFYQTTPASGSDYGYSLAVDNNEALVSSRTWTFGIPSIGKTFLYTITDGAMTQSDVFLPAEVLLDDKFGSAVAIQNDFIAIGAPARDDNFQNAGAVYLYHKTAGTYQFLQKITASDGGIDGDFGSFVRLSGNQLFVSAANSTTVADPDDGAVYIYNYNGSQWVFSQKIVTEGRSRIEVENNLLVTSTFSQNTDHRYTGVTLYTQNGGNWELSFTLPFGNLEQYIMDFSLTDNSLYAISRNIDNTASIFEYQQTINEEWGLYNYFSIDNTGDQVYTKIEVAGDNMFLGSTTYILQMDRKFPVLYYKKTESGWLYQNSFTGTGPVTDDYFGSVFASQGNSLIIGAPEDGGPVLNGRAYYLDLLPLATDSFEKESTVIYPNPTQGKINISNNSKAAIKKISVFSVTGNLLLESGNIDEVSLERLAAGIYLTKLSFADSSEQTFKIIKN